MAGRPPLPIGTAGKPSKPRLVESGRYETTVRYRDLDGKTRVVQAHGDTAAKATRTLSEKVRDRQRRGGNGELTAESTVAALIDRWVASLEKRRRSVTGTRKGSLTDGTIKTYTDIAERIVKPGLGHFRIRELSTQRLETWLDTQHVHKRHIRTVLMQSCKMGVQFELLAFNPMRETSVPPRPDPDTSVLTPEDYQVLMARAIAWTVRKPGQGGPKRGVDMVELVALLMATGERIGEVLALRWQDVAYLDDRTRPVEVAIAGTVDRDGIRHNEPKTKSGNRTLLLPEYGRDALLAQRERGLPFELIFPTRNGTPKRPGNVNRSWREIRGTDYAWVIPRTFRKTAATAIEREHGIEQAAKQLGHSSPEITRQFYVDRLREAPDSTAALEAFNPFPSNFRRPGPNLRVVGDD